MAATSSKPSKTFKNYLKFLSKITMNNKSVTIGFLGKYSIYWPSLKHVFG